MICRKCKNRWSVPEGGALGNCPVCGEDTLMMLNSQISNPAVDTILKNILLVHGNEFLNDKPRLLSVIEDWFCQDQRINRLLQLSIQYEVPRKLSELFQLDKTDITTHMSDLSEQIQEIAFLKEEAANEMLRYWEGALKPPKTLSTEIEPDDGEWIDDFGVKYSANKRKLIDCTDIKYSYNIIPGTEVICNLAFNNCYELEHLNIPSSVTLIGEHALTHCIGLIDIFVHKSNRNFCCVDGVLHDISLKTIICYPRGNNGLKTEYSILDSVTKIRESAFNGCKSLKSIIIPDSVTSIGSFAFNKCTGLTNIVIPDSVTSVGMLAFQQCDNLEGIKLSNLITKIDDFVFNHCHRLKSIVLPDSITSIGKLAFFGCYSLTNIALPDSVISIGEDAFFGCTNLNYIKIRKGNVILRIRLSELGNKILKTDSDFEYWTPVISSTKPRSVPYRSKWGFENGLTGFEDEPWWEEERRREWENDPENPNTWVDNS